MQATPARSGRHPLKPPFTYFGGKLSTAEQIVSLLPPHDHYIEPYCGSLAVLLAKPPSAMETVNDLDRSLMNFWRVLRDRPQDLERVCALTPHSRAEQQQSYEAAAGELEQARRTWVTLTQGRSGMLRRTGWRYYVDPRGSSSPMTQYLAGYVSRIAPAAARLSTVSLECRPAIEVIAKYGQHKANLLYVDPPYLGSTRIWGNQYQHEMRTEAEHRALYEALSAAAAAVVLSGYHSPLYDELYADWERAEIGTFNGNATNGSRRTEVLWSNRPFPHQQGTLDLSHPLMAGKVQ